MAALANLFLAGFGLDALLSLTDDAFRLAFGSSPFGVVRQLLASAVAVAALGVAGSLAVSARLPARVYAAPVLFSAWTWLGAQPLPLVVAPATLAVALGFAQLGLAWVAMTSARRFTGRRSVLLEETDLVAPGFAFERALRSALVAIVVVPPLAVGYALLTVASEVERVTAGFIAFDLDGVNSVTRVYDDGDRRVTLVGMVHIGEDGAYRELFDSFGAESTVVLEEGVTDRGNRLGDGLLYDELASRVGLGVQPSFGALLAERAARDDASRGPDVRRADVDTAAFSASTITLIRELGEVYRSGDLRTALRVLRERVETLGPAATETALRELIDDRNAYLLGELRAALEDYRHVVVPWGALHLPGIEEELIGWGFSPGEAARLRLVRYGTVAAALMSGLSAPVEGEPGDSSR